ncbi:MAG: sodium:proton antiporter [Streptococcaceae bacterium]|jgi:CPA1 family monovalent cation:H+ antiporter|nr:sodium:proton antiporter [Streptococcaceae bacterium]
MHSIELVIALFFLFILSNVLSRIFPRIPLPLMQITLGVIVGALLPREFLHIDTEVFLALVVSPLLFRDGQKIEMTSVLKHRYLVLFLAFGVVFITVFSLGSLLKMLFPVLPLAACFAIGASLGPTDVIAARSVSSSLNFPKRVQNVVKGEGLINDASGLIAFQFSILALTTGEFNLQHATLAFFASAMGGAVIGLIVSSVSKLSINLLEELDAKDVGGYLLIELLLPFFSFFIAEYFHVSGIIAAVVSGVLQASRFKKINLFDAQVSSVSETVWDTITFCLNTVVFLLLGIELEHVFAPTWLNPEYSNLYLLLTIALLTICLFLTRFVCLSLYYTIVGWRRKQKFSRYLNDNLLITFSGVKGTVSIATILLTPVAVSKVMDLKERPLMLFISSGVTLLSFFIGILVLPLLAEKKVNWQNYLIEIGLLEEVVLQLEKDSEGQRRSQSLNAAIDNYRSRIQELIISSEGENVRKDMQELRLMILQIEQDGLDVAYRRGEIDEESYDLYLKYVNRLQKMIIHRFVSSLHFLGLFVTNVFRKLFHKAIDFSKNPIGKKTSARKLTHNQRKDMRVIYYHNTELILEALENLTGIFDSTLIDFLQQERIRSTEIIHEKYFVDRVLTMSQPTNMDEMMRGYYLERKLIFEYEEAGLLNKKQAYELRKNVNTLESYSLEENYSTLPYEFFEYLRQSRGE